MNGFTRSTVAGVLGALTTNLLHELTRRSVEDAPRVDLLGMQALSKSVRSLGFVPPVGRNLYGWTLLGDMLSNSVYFAAVGLVPRRYAVIGGTAAGLIAGVGAVIFPARLGLSPQTTARTTRTAGLTCGLYTAGGIVAGLCLSE